MPLAEDALHRLLSRGERARLAASPRVIRESFKTPDSAYWQQPLDERDRMHALLERAASVGALTLEWARQGGEDRPLEGAVLRDLDRLAEFLRVPTAAIAIEQAAQALAPWQAHPRMAQVLDTWRQLKKVRSLGPDSAADFADALRLLDALAPATRDRLARPLSVELFGRSKRIEALYTHLDVLTADELQSPARHWSEVLGALGIRKEPQPLLIAGGGTLTLAKGPAVPVAQPFVGVANHALVSYHGAAHWLLSIENLTSFHQCAELLDGAEHGLLAFTGGMPSPSWMRAYVRILDGLPTTTLVYHWGDHDEGGFRIAARIARACRGVGRTLLPWAMNVSDGLTASASQHNAMANSARRAGWDALALTLPALLMEQEAQAPTLPAP